MSETPHTEPTESDPNADSADGLAGGMGVSSERPGEIRGKVPPGTDGVTYDHAPTQTAHDDAAATELGDEEVRPEPVEPHDFDPDRNPRHGV